MELSLAQNYHLRLRGILSRVTLENIPGLALGFEVSPAI